MRKPKLPKGATLTVSDAARFAGLSHARVWQYISEGRLKTLRVFGRDYVAVSELTDIPKFVGGRGHKARFLSGINGEISCHCAKFEQQQEFDFSEPAEAFRLENYSPLIARNFADAAVASPGADYVLDTRGRYRFLEREELNDLAARQFGFGLDCPPARQTVMLSDPIPVNS